MFVKQNSETVGWRKEVEDVFEDACGEQCPFTIQVFCPAFALNDIKVHFRPEYSAQTHPDPRVRESIQTEWLQRKRENPNLFDGSKFRFHSLADTENVNDFKSIFNLGLTSYGEFLGTNYGPLAPTLRADGLQSEHKLPQAYFSDPLGVGVYLTTTDGYVVCIERSQAVGEFCGYIDAPGGHPEPNKVWDPRYKDKGDGNLEKNFFLCRAEEATDLTFPVDYTELSPLQYEDMENRIRNELFNSIVEEICDETNIPKSCLNWNSEQKCMGLIAIIRQTAAYGRPSLLFRMACTLTKEQVSAEYNRGAKEAFETTRLHFFKDEVKHPYDIPNLPGKQFTPACTAMFAAVSKYQERAAAF